MASPIPFRRRRRGDFTRASKFWPSVGRVDNVYGDRNLVRSRLGMEAYAEAK